MIEKQIPFSTTWYYMGIPNLDTTPGKWEKIPKFTEIKFLPCQ